MAKDFTWLVYTSDVKVINFYFTSCDHSNELNAIRFICILNLLEEWEGKDKEENTERSLKERK